MREKKHFKKHVNAEFLSLTKDCTISFETQIRKKINKQDKKLMNKLKTIKKELDILEKKLINYLESKRVDFPRFYFVSNDDLIDILSSGKGMKTL